jgi:hypothetical protein
MPKSVDLEPGAAVTNPSAASPRLNNSRTAAARLGTFSAVEEARAHASVVAGELAQDTGWEGFSVLIADENGNEVARLPVVP